MLKECIDKILSLAPVQMLERVGHDGVKRSYTSSAIQPSKDPHKHNVVVGTLTGFMDLLGTPFNGFDKTRCFIQVENHELVSLKELASDIWGARQVHATAKLDQAVTFRFGEFMGQEQFIIGLQSLFVETDDRESLLKLVSTLTAEGISISEDDGVSQKATTRAGVALKKDETVKRVVTLAPYRTFREIEQPLSNFIFRVRGGPDQPPTCALFEADGGKWRIDAANGIKAWIVAKTLGMPVIA